MSACRLARDTNAKAIIRLTNSGYSSFRISHHRPNANIFIFTSNKFLMNMLGLYWGSRVFYYQAPDNFSTDQLIDHIKQILIEKGELEKGDVYINTLSMPFTGHGKTNALRLGTVE